MPAISKIMKLVRYFQQPDLYRYGLSSIIRLKNLKEEPVIVCGAPRSGTTLLISILDSHQDLLAIPYETWLFVNKRPQRWFRKEAWNHRFIFVLLKALLISTKIKKHHNRWIEKTPDNVLHLDFILKLFKRRVKIIHIIRDGRDVVLCHHTQLGHFMTPSKWVRYVEAGLKFRSDPNVLTLRYEDVISDFDSSMKKVSEFLHIKNSFSEKFYSETNVSDNSSVINGYGNKELYVAKPLSKASMEKWRKNPDITGTFNEYPLAIKLLEKLKYDTSTA